MSKKLKVEVSAIFNCDLERAFKIPILGDATSFLKGVGPLPGIDRFEDDDTWGQINGSRYPVAKSNLLTNGGRVGYDKIYERKENEYWNWGVTNIETFVFGITEFEGELFFEEISDGIHVRWVYHCSIGNAWLRPFAWIFFKWFWKKNINNAISYMKVAAEGSGVLLYK